VGTPAPIAHEVLVLGSPPDIAAPLSTAGSGCCGSVASGSGGRRLRHRELHVHAGPRSARVVEADSVAERLHTILQPDEARAAGEVGAADAVVATETRRISTATVTAVRAEACACLAWIHRYVLAPCHVFTGQRPFADRRTPHQEDARLQRCERALKQAGRTASRHYIGASGLSAPGPDVVTWRLIGSRL
jgi:hypothetical protein